MNIPTYFYKIFSRILFIISLILTVEIVVFGKSTFMEYTESALPYILALTILLLIKELISQKDKLYFRIFEIAMFILVLSQKTLALDLRIVITAVFILYLAFSIRYHEMPNS